MQDDNYDPCDDLVPRPVVPDAMNYAVVWAVIGWIVFLIGIWLIGIRVLFTG